MVPPNPVKGHAKALGRLEVIALVGGQWGRRDVPAAFLLQKNSKTKVILDLWWYVTTLDIDSENWIHKHSPLPRAGKINVSCILSSFGTFLIPTSPHQKEKKKNLKSSAIYNSLLLQSWPGSLNCFSSLLCAGIFIDLRLSYSLRLIKFLR